LNLFKSENDFRTRKLSGHYCKKKYKVIVPVF
jgi:hypothetical protein